MTDGLRTVLCERLDCRYPIVQTAMGWVADARLTAATCNAGGFGFLAAATLGAGEVEPELLRLKSLTNRPFGVNFHMFQPNADEVIDLIIAHRVKAVSYGRGPDAKTIARFKAAGVICMPTVGALKHAIKAVELGADIITVQGGEGGGHTGAAPTTVLLPQVIDAVNVPVVAAGGFFDGRGLAAALAYGAVGIAMGTRFLMTAESPVNRRALDRYVAIADPAVIRVTHAVDGLPQRFIVNQEIERLEQMSAMRRLTLSASHAWRWGRQSGLSIPAMTKLAVKAMSSDDATFAQTVMAPNLPTLVQRGLVQGDADSGLLPSGQAAAAIPALVNCDELISTIARDAEARIRALLALSGAAPQAARGAA